MSDNRRAPDGPRPLRTSWRDFPPEYITALTIAAKDGTVRLGPMTWNDARFAQREFYRLMSVLRRQAAGDKTAADLDEIARRLRPSCPRTDDDPLRHWFELRINPIVASIQQEEPSQ